MLNKITWLKDMVITERHEFLGIDSVDKWKVFYGVLEYDERDFQWSASIGPPLGVTIFELTLSQ